MREIWDILAGSFFVFFGLTFLEQTVFCFAKQDCEYSNFNYLCCHYHIVFTYAVVLSLCFKDQVSNSMLRNYEK